MCVGEDGHVAIELTARCALDATDETCESGRNVNACPCCISEDTSRDCHDMLISPYSLLSGSVVPKAPDAHFGGIVAVTGGHVFALSLVSANSYGNIQNPFFIESLTQYSISSIVLRI